MLRKLSKEDQDRICSQQVITELRDCVKELVDNSIDAECTEILVFLTDNGASTIEVIDNGTGIVDLEMIGERGNTSKLETFDHINMSLDTLGFRGEGLNSIVNSCETIEIDTKLDSDKLDNQSKIVFERGKIINNLNKYEKYNFAGKTGTKIKVVGLFFPYISRRKQFLKNIKQQLKSLVLLLEEYAICYPKIRFLLSNKILSDSEREKIHIRLTELNYKQQQKMELLMTRGNNSSQIDVAQYLWGKSILGDSIKLDLNGEIFIPKKQGSQTINNDSDENDLIGGKWSINGFISSIDKGRPSPDHQIFTINKRPIDPIKRISRSISSVYSSLSSFSNKKLHPAFVINIQIPPCLLDVNVTPNKRVIMLPSLVENILLENIQQCLLDSYQNSVPIRNYSDLKDSKLDNIEGNCTKNVLDEYNQTSNHINFTQKRNLQKMSDLHEEIQELSTNKRNNVDSEYICNNINNDPTDSMNRDIIDSNKHKVVKEYKINDRDKISGNIIDLSKEKKITSNNDSVKKLFKVRLNYNIPVPCIIEYKYQINHQEKQWKNRKDNRLSNVFNAKSSTIDYLLNDDIFNSINENEKNSHQFHQKNEKNFHFEKHLFNELEIIGQFNKGFILTKLFVPNSNLFHIFIIDQHASDEKARFENLNKDYSHIQTQKLISPLSISLTPSQEQIVLNYKDIFENNGFKFIFNNNLNIGSRIQLTQLPIVLGIPLKQLDFLDLVSQINKYKVNVTIGNQILSISSNNSQQSNISEQEDSISIPDEYTHKSTTLWCPLSLIPRPKKMWSILASK